MMTYSFNQRNSDKPPFDHWDLLDLLKRIIYICLGMLFIQAIFAITAVFVSPVLLGGTAAVLIMATLIYVIMS